MSTCGPRLSVDVALALDDFVLDVQLDSDAHVTGIFGASGSGKTSFLEVIAGLRRSATGRIRFGDAVWLDSSRGIHMPIERRAIGYVPQGGALFPHLSVRENLRFGARRAQARTGSIEPVFGDTVDLLELGPLLDRDPRTLSGGERQRVAIGRALCSRPELVLLDEPLAGLDERLRRRILPFLGRVCEEFATPMILVSHNPVEIQALCQSVAVLSFGRIESYGPPSQTLIQPDVFALANIEGFNNIFRCRSAMTDEGSLRVNLGSPPTEIALELIAPTTGPVRVDYVGVPARDVMISVDRPSGISARNVIESRIESIDTFGNIVLVCARIAPDLPPLVAQVGRRAERDLDLKEGRRVFLVVKAMSCQLYGENCEPATQARTRD